MKPKKDSNLRKLKTTDPELKRLREEEAQRRKEDHLSFTNQQKALNDLRKKKSQHPSADASEIETDEVNVCPDEDYGEQQDMWEEVSTYYEEMFHQQDERLQAQQAAFMRSIEDKFGGSQETAGPSKKQRIDPDPAIVAPRSLSTLIDGLLPTDDDHEMPLGHTSDEDEDMEADLAGLFAVDDGTADPIPEKLASVVNTILRGELPLDQEKEIADKYCRPSNCHTMVVPKINEELWPRLQKGTRQRDFKIQHVQSTMLRTMIPVIDLIIQTMKQKDKDSLTKLTDVLKLLAISFKALSVRRRDLLVNDLSPKYRQLCAGTLQATEHLFGDDLAKKVKELDEINSLSQRVQRRPKFPFSNRGTRGGGGFGRGRYRGGRGAYFRRGSFLPRRGSSRRGGAQYQYPEKPKK